MSSKREVVVTGMGVLCPIGIDLDAYWNALINGVSGVGFSKSIQTQLERKPICAETPDFKPKDYIKPKKNIKVMSRDIQLGMVASILATQNANLNLDNDARAVEPERLGCIFGCDLIGLELDALLPAFKQGIKDGKFDFSTWGRASMESIMPLWLLRYLPNMAASHFAISVDARGPNNTNALDRGSSLAAIMEGCRIIERGAADVMVVGGVGNKLNPTILARGGAYNLAPYSENPQDDPRPFDADRRGTVVGDGAGAFVLESREFAEARGAKIYGTILSFAEAVEPTATFGIQQDAIESAIRQTLRNAHVDAADVGHVNANALGVPDDSKEALALRNQLGDVPVFAAAGHLGNLGSGAGAVELVASFQAVANKQIPATRNCDKVAQDCPVNVVKAQPQPLDNNLFLKLSHANTGRSFAILVQAQ
ncbi:MAG: beta-ketoacyl synthase N-terminal-like domain-containing protein [Planctomycetia bacterium]|nr:beta-ketoacyl synthase N-terminal-like domain-containing protein [Planctomycetia bacterium]